MRYVIKSVIYTLVVFVAVLACGTTEEEAMEETIDGMISTSVVVEKVSVTGEDRAYNFSVTLSSPDIGCDQYADWWEVIDEEGALVYRRILAHSHVDEQPFSRSGGRVDIEASQKVYVRGHMNNTGYGTVVMLGSVTEGWTKVELVADFAAGLADEAPLPDGCPF